MPNYFELWNFYMKDIPAPQQYIEWGFFSMMGASLQRRVYVGETKRIHPNQFIVFVGPPGTGKGLVTEEITRVFTHPKLKKHASTAEKEALMHELAQATGKMKNPFEDNLRNMLIPLSPNSTTYESLCKTLGECARSLRVPTGKIDDQGKTVVRLEATCSLYAILEELGSLVRERTQDVHVFLQETYDCKPHYEYKTKHGGDDFIKRPCFNLLGGTTSEFLRRAYSSTLLAEGFSSRTVFVVGDKPKKRMYEIPEFSKEQREAFEQIVDHVVKLSVAQGQLYFSPEAKEYNRHWYEVEYSKSYPNPHPRLVPYYSRITIHHMKMSMVMHCAKHDPNKNREIDLDTAKEALKILQSNEASMHVALAGEQRNPYSELKEGMLHFIKHQGTVTKKQLIVTFYDACPTDKPYEDIEEVIKILKDSGDIIDSEDGRANVYVYKGQK